MRGIAFVLGIILFTLAFGILVEWIVPTPNGIEVRHPR
jgi:hypothetical protein